VSDTRTDDELRAAISDGDRARRVLAERSGALAKTTKARIERLLQADRTAAFESGELRFAAFTRCECGAGMAYPPSIGAHGEWNCSAILRGKAPKGGTHSPPLAFAFYEIKSEAQPSAGGATTRPADEHGPLPMDGGGL